MRTVGTSAMGIRTPIIREGDDLVAIVISSLEDAVKHDGVTIRDYDVVGITEAVLARAQGNYATVDQIAADVHRVFGDETVGVVFPIMSRNRFAMLLKGIARGAKRVIVQLSYPSDEVGNMLISMDDVEAHNIDPFSQVLTESEYRGFYGDNVTHRFTGVDYVDYYKRVAGNIDIILANDPRAILKYTDSVIAADIHSRARTKRVIKAAGGKTVISMDELLTAPVEGSGYNAKYGLLGSNKASEERVKLFPRDGEAFVNDVKSGIMEKFGKDVHVIVYGDGCFKDPIGGIWELADPVVVPFHTEGLLGTPNELKLKYLADNDYADLSKEDAKDKITEAIKNKGARSLMGKMESEGTTPRRLTDLLGSLCDLTSGSGDKGTPIVLIQGYFDNYAS